jgi:hypothetical protein
MLNKRYFRLLCCPTLILMLADMGRQATAKAQCPLAWGRLPGILTMVSFPIPGFIREDGTGPFVDLVKEFERRSGQLILLDILPPRRARQRFFGGHYDAYFPTTISKIPAWLPVCRTEAIYTKRDFLFLKKAAKLKKTQLRSTLRIGLVAGYDYSKMFLNQTRIKFEYTASTFLNIRKLLKGRLDGFVAEEYEARQAMDALAVGSQIYYSPDEPVAIDQVYMVFQKTPHLKPSCREFRQISARLQRQRWLRNRLDQQVSFEPGVDYYLP